MQPPEQPQNPNPQQPAPFSGQYSQNPYANAAMANPYGQMANHPADLPIGILIIVVYGLAALAGLLGFLGGAAVGAGASASVGGFVMIVSIVLLLVSVLMIAGGAGIIKGARWGFMVCGVMATIGVVLGLFSFAGAMSVVRLLIGVALAIYCFMRLSGQLGPRPN